MDRHTPKGSVRTGHGVPCGALPLIKTEKKKKKKKRGQRGGRCWHFNAPTHPPVLYAEAYTFVFSPRPRSKIYCVGPVSLDRIALNFWIQLQLRPE